VASLEKALLLNQFGRWRPRNLPEASPADIPPTFILDGKELAQLRAARQNNIESVVKAVNSLESCARKLLELHPPSVTQKTSPNNGANLHDYVSLAKYWWPNPAAANGLPYIRRDGQINPEAYRDCYDAARLVELNETLLSLALAAYLTGNPLYASKAVQLLDTWFVNLPTRQTPHLEYAQLKPGCKSIQWHGIIEGRHYIYIAESVILLSHIKAIPATINDGVRSWYSDMLQWLRSSEIGQKASGAKNNIGVWYDLICIAFANFINDTDVLPQIFILDALDRLNSQCDTDGSLPAELQRENPYEYVAFTLVALSALSAACTRLDASAWSTLSSDGRNFQAAHDWLRSLTESQALKIELATAIRHHVDTADDPALDEHSFLYNKILTRVCERQRKLISDQTIKIGELNNIIVNLKKKPIRLFFKNLITTSIKYIVDLSKNEQTIALYKIISNEIALLNTPAHITTIIRSIKNIEILPKSVNRYWILDQIADPECESAIINQLKQAGESYLRIPFHADKYRATEWNMHLFYAGTVTAHICGLTDCELMNIYKNKISFLTDTKDVLLTIKRHSRTVQWHLATDATIFVTAGSLGSLHRVLNYKPTNPAPTLSLRKLGVIKSADTSFRPTFSEYGSRSLLHAHDDDPSLERSPTPKIAIQTVDCVEELIFGGKTDDLGLPSIYASWNRDYAVRSHWQESISSQFVNFDREIDALPVLHETPVAFAISVKGKSASRDWTLVQKYLAQTIRSIIANTHRQFIVVVAGHEKPDIPEIMHPHVRWLSVKHAPPSNPLHYPADKMKKRMAIGAYLASLDFTGYFFPCDADDWISYRTVEYIHKMPRQSVLLADRGLMVNQFTKQAWIRKSGFFKGCGTCCAILVNKVNLPQYPSSRLEQNNAFFYASQSHAQLDALLEKARIPFAYITKPIVAWILANGENASNAMGKKSLLISSTHYGVEGYEMDASVFEIFRVH